MTASNTFDCFRECVGKRVVGVLRDAMPPCRRDIAAGTKTLVFDDGTGLTIASNGSYWTERKDEIDRAIRIRREELEANHRDIQDVLDLAGASA
jgi:hypothetical protein